MSSDPFESPREDPTLQRQEFLELEIGWGGACLVALPFLAASITALYFLQSNRYMPDWMSIATWDFSYHAAVVISNLSGTAVLFTLGGWIVSKFVRRRRH